MLLTIDVNNYLFEGTTQNSTFASLRNLEMKTIARHISSMLYDHECVIVPRLGAFITNSVDATIDVNRGLLLPPRKEVVFNMQLTHNDGLLTNYIAQSEKITYAEATARIKAFVDDLKANLEDGEIVSLPYLGKMALLKNDAVAFTSNSKMNYLSEAYGLGSISAPVLSSKVSYTIRLGAHPQAKRVAGWAAAVALLLCFGPRLNDGSVPERNDANYASLASVFESSMVKATSEEESQLYYDVAESIVEEPQEELRYHIIIGSFPTLKDAKRRRAELEKKGITDIELITTPNKKRVRLSVASFSSQEEAKKQTHIIRKIHGMEKAWVLKD